MKDPAPLFTDTYDLTSWLLGRLHTHPSHLAAELGRLAPALLDAVTAALRRRDDMESLDEADELLASLRLRLRLAAEVGILAEPQMLHALQQADTIGRQLGALLRHRAGG